MRFKLPSPRILITIAILLGCIIGSVIAQQQVSGNNVTVIGTVSSNTTQLGGNAIATGNGTTNTGTQRVTISSDSTGQVTLATGANTIGQLTANQSVNLNQVSGSAIATAAAGILKAGVTDGTGTAITSTGAALDVNIKSGSIANTFFRMAPASCSQTTNFTSSTVQVATGAGSSVTSTTTCVTLAYANNITNSAVTIRIQDKQATPVIWVGGNADFSIPANSNMRIPLDGTIFTSGITAIAGTGSAVNLQINGLQ